MSLPSLIVAYALVICLYYKTEHFENITIFHSLIQQFLWQKFHPIYQKGDGGPLVRAETDIYLVSYNIFA